MGVENAAGGVQTCSWDNEIKNKKIKTKKKKKKKKNSYKFSKGETDNPKRKMEKDLNRKFTKDNIQLANKYLKMSLNTEEMQIKTTMWYLLLLPE